MKLVTFPVSRTLMQILILSKCVCDIWQHLKLFDPDSFQYMIAESRIMEQSAQETFWTKIAATCDFLTLFSATFSFKSPICERVRHPALNFL